MFIKFYVSDLDLCGVTVYNSIKLVKYFKPFSRFLGSAL